MRQRPIVVTESDERRLRGLLAVQSEASLHDQEHLQELRSELERAVILRAKDVPADVVTMNSRVCVLDLLLRKRSDITLVFPLEADVTAKRISVLAPLGTALLGFREGDDVEWQMPGGMRRLRVERVRQRATNDSGGSRERSPFSCGPIAAVTV
ncbi:MAG TPA: nucleoside diphosphate kinase regulator [Steroidobacteraceae bacterium]